MYAVRDRQPFNRHGDARCTMTSSLSSWNRHQSFYTTEIGITCRSGKPMANRRFVFPIQNYMNRAMRPCTSLEAKLPLPHHLQGPRRYEFLRAHASGDLGGSRTVVCQRVFLSIRLTSRTGRVCKKQKACHRLVMQVIIVSLRTASR
jgi:hypothetical protein